VKTCKIAINSTTTEAVERYWLLFSTNRSGSMGTRHYFYCVKTNKIAINSKTKAAFEKILAAIFQHY